MTVVGVAGGCVHDFAPRLLLRAAPARHRASQAGGRDCAGAGRSRRRGRFRARRRSGRWHRAAGRAGGAAAASDRVGCAIHQPARRARRQGRRALEGHAQAGAARCVRSGQAGHRAAGDVSVRAPAVPLRAAAAHGPRGRALPQARWSRSRCATSWWTRAAWTARARRSTSSTSTRPCAGAWRSAADALRPHVSAGGRHRAQAQLHRLRGGAAGRRPMPWPIATTARSWCRPAAARSAFRCSRPRSAPRS